MALHHRQNVGNMRSAYDTSLRSQRSHDSDSERSYGSSSARSYATQATEYSGSAVKRPPHVHYHTFDGRAKDLAQPFFNDRQQQESPHASVETYASTVDNDEEEEEVRDERMPDYDVPEYQTTPDEPCALAATPTDFSELFPSRRRLLIHHDDSTLDGNMNLRVDAEVYAGDRKCDMTLFHLRMHDLKERQFSLRRYCRDSGREVCHTARKQQNLAAPSRPGFQRSLSNALNSIRPRSASRAPTLDSLKRSDSGYGSMHSADFDENDRPCSAGHGATSQPQVSTDTIKLEFSNYAQMEVKRIGAKGHKRYEFEYWGTSYAWRRIVQKENGIKTISYHLTKSGTEKVLAYIVPVSLNCAGADEEYGKGGWVPQCSMWLSDAKLIHGQKDAADAVIASGLIALVDDSIRAHFKSKATRQLLVPMHSVGVEYVGPKRLINELFRRDSSESSHQRRPSSSWKPNSNSRTSTASRVRPEASRQLSHERGR